MALRGHRRRWHGDVAAPSCCRPTARGARQWLSSAVWVLLDSLIPKRYALWAPVDRLTGRFGGLRPGKLLLLFFLFCFLFSIFNFEFQI
jgi:hypothetical protein